MPPQSQDLEAFIKNIEKLEGLPGDFNREEEQKRDFDSFFEKLSSLDDMNFATDPRVQGQNSASDAPRSAGKSAPRPNSAHRPRSSRSEAQPAPERVQSAPSPFATWETEKSAGLPLRGPSFMQRALFVCKVSLIAVGLFSVGLVGGFLALSIPDRVDSGISGLSAPRKRGSDAATIPGKSASQPAVVEVSAGTPGTDAGEQNLIITENGKVAARIPFGKSTVSAAPAQAAIVPIELPAPRDSAPAPQRPAHGGKYALQVGACRSAECVAQYRTILVKHVDARNILVVEKNLPSGGEPLLRIRIDHLTRAEARTLHGRLSAADARFRNAYLVGGR